MEYDPFLGVEELVITSKILQGALKYQIIRRDVFIYGFYDLYIASKTIDIDIWGVTNPNRVNNIRSSEFGIGLLNNITNDKNSLIEGYFSIQGIIPLLAPGFF